MCIGIPCLITEVFPGSGVTALATVNGVEREVDISLLKTNSKVVSSEHVAFDLPQSARTAENQIEGALVGKWVLVHAGYALNFLDEEEALMILKALECMEELEPDVGYLLYGENAT